MEKEKEKLINSLKAKGFSEVIISAFEKVKREDFVPEHLKSYAYEDIALPIESGSTISQPSTIAFMLSLLDPKQDQKILEVGSGSGYVLALISEIIKDGKIYGLELNKRLAIRSKEILEKNKTIEIFYRSGFLGLPDFAPFDKIIISASAPDMRIPYNLIEQLKNDGTMVSPVRSSICKLTKTKESGICKEEHHGFAFVPLREEE